VRNHLVGPALEGQQLAGVVVPEADVVGDIDAAADGGDQGGEQWLGVEIGGLDENGFLGVADGGEEGFVLGVVDAGVVGGWACLAMVVSIVWKYITHSPRVCGRPWPWVLVYLRDAGLGGSFRLPLPRPVRCLLYQAGSWYLQLLVFFSSLI